MRYEFVKIALSIRSQSDCITLEQRLFQIPSPVLCSEPQKACSSSRRLPMAGPPSAAEVKSGLSRPGLEPRAVRHSRMSMAKPLLLTVVRPVAPSTRRRIAVTLPLG